MSFNFTETLRYAFAAAVLAVAGSAQAVEYTATPATGDVTTLNTIEVSFAGVQSVSELSYGTTLSSATQNYRIGTGVSANKYVVSVRETLTAGSYTLTIPSGTVALDGNALNEAISLTYNVAGTGYTGASITPAPGRVSSLSQFVVTLNGAAQAAYIANSTETAAYLTRDGERVVTFGPYNAVTSANTITFSCYEPQTAAGNYQLVVPANSVAADGNSVEAFTTDYSIVVPQVTVSPETGVVTALDNVAFTFNGVSQLTEVTYSGVSFVNGDGQAVRYTTSVDGNVFYVKPIDALTPGDYNVTVAAGTLSADGFSYDQELTAAYTLTVPAPEYEAVASPANGASLITLDRVEITFNGLEMVASIVESTPQAPYVALNGNRVYTIMNILCEGNVMTLTLPEALTEAGTYTVVVPGSGYTPDGVNYGRDLEFTYHIKGLDYNVTPEGEVSKLEAITLTFNGVTAVSEVGYNVMLVNTMTNCPVRVKTSVSGNTYTVTAIDPVTTAGSYELTIPANTVALDGVVLGADIVEYFYVVPEEANFTVSANPAEGDVTALQTIEVTLEGAENVVIAELNSETAPYLTDAEGNRRATFTNVSAKNNVMTIGMYGEYKEAGAVKVIIPAATYTVNGIEAREIVLNYNITDEASVDSVIADAQLAPVRVYNVSGQLINRAANAEAIKALPAGFYIINGKKVVK